MDLPFVELCVHDDHKVSVHVDRPSKIAWHNHHLYGSRVEELFYNLGFSIRQSFVKISHSIPHCLFQSLNIRRQNLRALPSVKSIFFFLKMLDPLFSYYKYFKTCHVRLLAQSRISFSLSITFRQDVGSLSINARRACPWMCTVQFSFFSHKSKVLVVFLSSLLFSPFTRTLYCK